MNLAESANSYHKISPRSVIKVNLRKNLAKSFSGLETSERNRNKNLLYLTSNIFIIQVDEKRWLLFDATMGDYDRAEPSELVETFSLASVYIMTAGCQYLKTQLRIKKPTENIQDFVLEIEAESNLRIVNYLDVTLNLNDGSFRPCDKSDDIIQYIKEFNHPPNLIKHLPASIEKRLSNNSFDEKIFLESAIYNEDTLNKARYLDKVIYHTPSASDQENKNKNRQHSMVSPTM